MVQNVSGVYWQYGYVIPENLAGSLLVVDSPAAAYTPAADTPVEGTAGGTPAEGTLRTVLGLGDYVCDQIRKSWNASYVQVEE